MDKDDEALLAKTAMSEEAILKSARAIEQEL
jgi:hypothetical protein